MTQYSASLLLHNQRKSAIYLLYIWWMTAEDVPTAVEAIVEEAGTVTLLMPEGSQNSIKSEIRTL